MSKDREAITRAKVAIDQIEGWLENLEGKDYVWDFGANGYDLDTADIRALASYYRITHTQPASEPSEAMVERVARAISVCDNEDDFIAWEHNQPSSGEAYWEYARAAIAALTTEQET